MATKKKAAAKYDPKTYFDGMKNFLSDEERIRMAGEHYMAALRLIEWKGKKRHA